MGSLYSGRCWLVLLLLLLLLFCFTVIIHRAGQPSQQLSEYNGTYDPSYDYMYIDIYCGLALLFATGLGISVATILELLSALFRFHRSETLHC